MKTTLVMLLLFGFLACEKNDSATDPEQEVLAQLNRNQLPFDGCQTHVALNWNDPNKEIRYLPDPESRARIETYVGEQVYQKEARITYRLTGNRSSIQCGWGRQLEADEITIISIR